MPNKHGTISPIRPWNFYHYYIAASTLYGIDMPVKKNVNTYLFAVIDSVPGLLDQFRGIWHTNNRKPMVTFFDAKKDYSAIRVRKRTIRLP